MPVVNRDLATVLLHAFADAHPLSPAGREGGARAGEDAPRGVGRPGDPALVRQVDPPGLDGRRLPGGPPARSRRQDVPPRRPLRARTDGHDRRADRSLRRASRRHRRPREPWRTVAWWPSSASSPSSPCRRCVDRRTTRAAARVADRIANPDVTGAPRPVEPLFGDTHWLTLHQIGTIVMMISLVDGRASSAWRRHPAPPDPAHGASPRPLLVWQDPIMNWAPYAVYNPQLWHWPETWPLVSLSPTVEPFIVIGYATFYMAPFFPAIWILRRLQARASGRVVRLAPPARQPGGARSSSSASSSTRSSRSSSSAPSCTSTRR